MVREFMAYVFGSDAGFEVAGVAEDGAKAVSAVHRLRPDVVLMDVHMPNMDGLEATRRIMREAPVPIVIVSGTVEDQVAGTFAALEAGALAFVPRPAGINHVSHQREVSALLRTVRLMSEVKVVRRRGDAATVPVPGSPLVVAVGASTGGPVSVQMLVQALPRDFALPVLVVQHIAEGFLPGFVDWLGRSAPLAIRLAADGEALQPGTVYVAPDGAHLGVERPGRIRLSGAPPDNGLRPSVAHLFRSVLAAYRERAAAVLLSGMGRDGAAELLELRSLGAQTFVQNRETSVVYGMPGAAIELDAALHVMHPGEIAAALARLAAQSDRGAL